MVQYTNLLSETNWENFLNVSFILDTIVTGIGNKSWLLLIQDTAYLSYDSECIGMLIYIVFFLYWSLLSFTWLETSLESRIRRANQC